jgi:hypothetical protein
MQTKCSTQLTYSNANAFGSTFAFFQAHNAKQKMQKSYQANARQTDEQKGYAYNKVLPQWGLTFLYETFVLKQTAVHLLNICAKNPPLRQYPNR